jgi:hypothetical protein
LSATSRACLAAAALCSADCGWSTAICTMLQGLACQRPANRAIAQSGNRIGQTCVDERLGANNAACGPRSSR